MHLVPQRRAPSQSIALKSHLRLKANNIKAHSITNRMDHCPSQQIQIQGHRADLQDMLESMAVSSSYLLTKELSLSSCKGWHLQQLEQHSKLQQIAAAMQDLCTKLSSRIQPIGQHLRPPNCINHKIRCSSQIVLQVDNKRCSKHSYRFSTHVQSRHPFSTLRIPEQLRRT